MSSELKRIRQDQRRIANEARAKINGITDNMSARDCKRIEAEFDAMMAEHDLLEERANEIKSAALDADPRRPSGGGGEARGGVDEPGVWTDFRAGLRGEVELRATMAVGSGVDGGYAVPAEIDRTILDQLVEVSPVRGVAEIVITNSTDYSKIVNRRGTASGWGNENTTVSDTDAPILAKISPPTGVLWARPAVTNLFLADSMFDAEAFLNDNVATEFAFQESSAFITGDGVDKPRGFTTYSTAATTDATRAFGTIEHLAAASATAVTADELIQLLYKLKPAYRQGNGVAWMMNSTTSSAIRQLKDSQNRYLWTDGLQPGQPPQLLGHPVVLVIGATVAIVTIPVGTILGFCSVFVLCRSLVSPDSTDAAFNS